MLLMASLESFILTATSFIFYSSSTEEMVEPFYFDF